MNSLDINTSHNVTIQYEVGSLADRMLAYLIDSIIKVGYIIFIAVVYFGIFDGKNAYWLLALLALPFLFYSLLFETFMEGQTPGKRIRQIKVVKLDGAQAGFGAYLIRWMFRLIDINILSGMVAIITILVNKRGQRLGDILAQTAVIRVQDRVLLKDTLYERVNSNHQVTYPEAQKLTGEDIVLIKRVLNTPNYRDNFEMFYTLTNKIQAKMGVTRTESPEDFLSIVVKDYNHLQDE